jgi:ankyrin repeat protein
MQQSSLLGNVSTMSFLLDNGADVNLKDNSGDTALHYAVDVCDPDKVKFLLGKKIDVNAKNKNGETALDIAKKNGFNVCITLLEKSLTSSLVELRAARLAAFSKEAPALVSQSEGQALAVPIKAVTSPLDIRDARLAALDKKPVLTAPTKAPISKARVSSVDSKDNIQKFVENKGDIRISLKMLEEGIISDINIRDISWFDGTALMYQAMIGTVESIESLLTHKPPALPNLQDIGGQTALHWAVYSKNPAKVQLLLDYGADPMIMDKRGATALSNAIIYNRPKIIEVLEDYIPPSKTGLSSSSSSAAAVSALASKSPPPSSSSSAAAAAVSALASKSPPPSSSSSSSSSASEPPQKGIEYIQSEPGIRITPIYDPLNPFKRGHFKKGGKTRKKIDTLIRRTPIKTIRKVNKNNKITRKKTKKTKKNKKKSRKIKK